MLLRALGQVRGALRYAALSLLCLALLALGAALLRGSRAPAPVAPGAPVVAGGPARGG